MIAAQLVTFFMLRFVRLAWMVRLVSTVVATRSRNDSVHSVARRTWSKMSWKYGLFDQNPATQRGLKLLGEGVAAMDGPLLQQADGGHIGQCLVVAVWAP